MANRNVPSTDREDTEETPQPPAGPGERLFSPAIEVFTEAGEVCVRADLPGLKREDIRAEVIEDHLILSGERRAQEERNERGLVRSERRYGSFRRVIPLPEGTDAESAHATFHDGVLEIRLKHAERKGRSIEIGEGPSARDSERSVH